MYEYSIVQWLFFFYFYCFFGWCFESTYVSIKSKKLVNRGFMRGPFLPLYGSGGIMMLVVSAPFQSNIVLTYLAGCVGATILEYVTGVVMESLFKVRYWDYSKKKFNFQGHICLSSTLAWGGLTILMTHFAHRLVEGVVFAIPSQVLSIMTVFLTIAISFDFALSFKAAMELKDMLITMDRMREELSHVKDELAKYQKRADMYIALANEDIEEAIHKVVEEGEKHLEPIRELKNSLEVLFEQVKNDIMDKPTEYMETAKEDLHELRVKYKTTLTKLEMTSNVKDWYKKNMIRSNPSMTSKLFGDSFDEVKRILFSKDEE